MPTTYPAGPGVPVINGVGDMTVDEFLKDPKRIQRTLEALPNQYFLGEYLLRPDTAPSGVVIYDELSERDMYLNDDPNRQPQQIEPGSEFPAVDVTEKAPNVVEVSKRGGYFPVTDEQIRRDRRDVIRRGLLRLSNTLVKGENQRVLDAVTGNATILSSCTTGAVAAWDSTGSTPNPVADIRGARSAIDNNDLGYSADTAIIHPDAFDVLISFKDIVDRLPRENTALNPMLNKTISGLLGLNWVVSRRCPSTKLIVLQRQMVGALATEVPPNTDVIDERIRERKRVQSKRTNQPVITDPYSVFVVTGVLQ